MSKPRLTQGYECLCILSGLQLHCALVGVDRAREIAQCHVGATQHLPAFDVIRVALEPSRQGLDDMVLGREPSRP